MTFLKVSGTVDETFSAGQLSQQIRADTILHLGKVNRFSSFGVREWVRLMKDLQGRVKNCLLVECSPAVVNQINVVVDFAAGAHVKSVQLPYVCQNCELDKLVTVDVDAQRQELLEGRLPTVPCPQCKNPMVFDDLPSSYLAFLRDAAAPDPSSPMAKFIAAFEQAAPKLDGGETLPRATEVAAAQAVAPPPPALDPSVPPPGMGGGVSPVARYGLVAAVVLVLAGVAWTVFRRPPEAVQPQTPIVDNTPKPPPGPPPKRDLSNPEMLQLTTLINNEQFKKALEMLDRLQPELLDGSHATMTRQVRDEQARAVEKHLVKAAELSRKKDFSGAGTELEAAIAAGGETDRIVWQRLTTQRGAGNCPEVIAAANAMEERYPDSAFLKQAGDYKKACQSLPLIPAAELQRVMATIKTEMDGCLQADRPPELASLNSFDLAWTVTAAGAPKDVSCTTPALAKTTLCNCFTEQVRRLKFSAKPQARRGAYTVTSG